MFDYSQNFSKLDFKRNPEIYRVGNGEQGVLLVEPYKSELLPLGRFNTPVVARESTEAILKKFAEYLHESDFAGMDRNGEGVRCSLCESFKYLI